VLKGRKGTVREKGVWLEGGGMRIIVCGDGVSR